jgi:hypothetical protein
MLYNFLKIGSIFQITVITLLTIQIIFSSEVNEEVRNLLVRQTVNFIMLQSFLPKEERWIFK